MKSLLLSKIAFHVEFKMQISYIQTATQKTDVVRPRLLFFPRPFDSLSMVCGCRPYTCGVLRNHLLSLDTAGQFRMGGKGTVACSKRKTWKPSSSPPCRPRFCRSIGGHAIDTSTVFPSSNTFYQFLTRFGRQRVGMSSSPLHHVIHDDGGGDCFSRHSSVSAAPPHAWSSSLRLAQV